MNSSSRSARRDGTASLRRALCFQWLDRKKSAPRNSKSKGDGVWRCFVVLYVRLNLSHRSRKNNSSIRRHIILFIRSSSPLIPTLGQPPPTACHVSRIGGRYPSIETSIASFIGKLPHFRDFRDFPHFRECRECWEWMATMLTVPRLPAFKGRQRAFSSLLHQKARARKRSSEQPTRQRRCEQTSLSMQPPVW